MCTGRSTIGLPKKILQHSPARLILELNGVGMSRTTPKIRIWLRTDISLFFRLHGQFFLRIVKILCAGHSLGGTSSIPLAALIFRREGLLDVDLVLFFP